MKEQTRGKRLLSILLACIMMISLVPTTVFAAQKYLDKDISESNWTYTGSTKTLQLSNYNGSDRFYTSGNVDLTVELVGTNTITYDINNTNDYSYYAIYGGNVTFTGSGTLNINLATGSDDYRQNLSAICATKKLTIENNVTLNINIVNT